MKPEASLLDEIEVQRAQIGPRAMKDPGSREYAIQTLCSLKRYLESKEIDERRLREELDVIKEHKHWSVLGYASLDEYLKTETGLTAAEILGRAKQAVIRAVCAAAEEAGVLKHGGDRKSESADQGDNSNLEPKRGNDQTYLARKLLTEQPETFELLKAGEFRSVRAAAKHCGIVKDKPTKAVSIESPDAAIAGLRKVFSDEAIKNALRSEQADQPAPGVDDDEHEDRFARLIDPLSIPERVELLRYLMHSPIAIPEDSFDGLTLAQDAFHALDGDVALSFMEWANNQAWTNVA